MWLKVHQFKRYCSQTWQLQFSVLVMTDKSEIFLKFLLNIPRFLLFLMSECSFDHIIGPKYLIECFPYITVLQHASFKSQKGTHFLISIYAGSVGDAAYAEDIGLLIVSVVQAGSSILCCVPIIAPLLKFIQDIPCYQQNHKQLGAHRQITYSGSSTQIQQTLESRCQTRTTDLHLERI